MDALVIARHLYGPDYLKRFLVSCSPLFGLELCSDAVLCTPHTARAAQHAVTVPRVLQLCASHGVRPDGRTPGQCRPVAVSGGDTERGSPVVARVGGTMVSCGIRPELATPSADRPEEGFLVPNVDIPPLCDPGHRPGPPSNRAQVMSHRLLDVLQRVPVVKATELCIVKMKLCWCLFIDVVCLSDDGGLFDAVVLAVMIALRKLLLPKVVVEDKSVPPVVQPAHSHPLPINCLVTAATVASVDHHLLLDPTSEESSLAQATVTVLTDARGALCGVYKQGEAVDSKHLLKCIKESAKPCNDIHEVLQSIAKPSSEQPPDASNMDVSV